MERALGANPNTAGPATATQLTTVLGKLAINFSRNIAASDMTLSVWAADDPAGPWTELARSTNGAPFAVIATGATAGESGAGATRDVQVGDIHFMNAPAHPRRFLRLHAQ